MELSFEIQSKYFEAFFLNSPIAIVTLDSEHKVVSLNPAFEKLFGYSLEELEGESVVGRRWFVVGSQDCRSVT